jgi:hypothetical protein
MSTANGDRSTARLPGDSSAPRIAGLVLVFLVITAVVFVFVKTLVFDRPLNDRALQQSLVAASVGVTVVCLIAWLLDLLQILELRAGWGKFLWTVLVASVLGNSALVYKRFATQANTVAIACLRPLATDTGADPMQHPYALRANTVYRRGEPFAFFVSLRDLQKDQSGDYSIDFRYAFEDHARGKSAFHEFHFAGNAEKLKTAPARQKRKDEYRAIAPECIDDNTVQAAQAMTFSLQDFPPGVYVLRTTVYDKVSASFAVADLPVQVVESL